MVGVGEGICVGAAAAGMVGMAFVAVARRNGIADRMFMIEKRLRMW